MSENPSPEILSKEERFKQNPDRWVCLDELIIAVMRSSEGLKMFCNPHSRKEAIMVKGECDAVLTKQILEIDIVSEAERKGAIVPAKGGLIQFARDRFKR